jgi:hypothetical protein
MIDSGATEHITSYRSNFISYLPFKSTHTVTLVDQVTQCNIEGQGTIKGTTTVNGKVIEICLQNVLHVPGINKQFISTICMDQKGFCVQHYNGEVHLKTSPTGKTFAIG